MAGGKSIFSYDYIYNNQHLGTGSTSTTSGARGLFDVKPNTYYTLSTNLPLRPDNGKYVIMKASDDFNDSITSISNGASAGNTITVKSTENGHIIIAFFKSMMSLDMQSKLETGEYWFQIEEGQTPTKFESYIETPQKDLSIPYYSTGNRNYKANWVKDYNIEYDLDGGTITGQPTTYNEETDTFALPTPTKEGYTFAGWTGGKNLYWRTQTSVNGQGVTSIRNNDGTISFSGTTTTSCVDLGGYYTNMFLQPGTYTIYTPNTNTFTTCIKGKYTDNSIKEDRINPINGGITTIEYTDLYNYYIYLREFAVGQELNDTAIIQIEKGSEFTGYEAPVGIPALNLTIPKGSKGNRKYTANWIQNE